MKVPVNRGLYGFIKTLMNLDNLQFGGHPLRQLSLTAL
jgi:hypothetical protein